MAPFSRHAVSVCIAVTMAICTAAYSPAQPSGASAEPILRIETGMHTAAIKRIAIDAANRYLVTSSDDKTVRVWELSSGRLLRVIRVPIGAGDEGKLYAVALSPDGGTIAASGFTSAPGEPTNIYLFDRESGRLAARLDGLPNVVDQLVYSPDGRFLAATLGGQDGVRLFSTSPYAQAGEDKDYGSDSYGADFDGAGRLVTTCYDGFVRLYATGSDGSFRLLAKRGAEGGHQPVAVKFSPDGTRLAVGFTDSTKVAVLSSVELAPLYMPDTTGISNGDMSKVTWSADGSTLYAAGRALDANRRKFLRAWTNGGRGAYRDIVVDATNTVQHLLPLRNGGIVYGASGPCFGVIDASGKTQLFAAAAIPDYRNNWEGFQVAPDGSGVQFAYQIFGEGTARFSLRDRKLDTAPAGQVSWRPPETQDEKIRVTDWEDTYTPKLNGASLKLDRYETSRSLAIAPDRSAFLLGTEWGLRLYDSSGAERWDVPVPGVAWAVNISADGRIALAAFGDGTIRWYRMSDGKELLAFFPHNDRKRWILWTPSGYYDASPGAEDLIGWHVNNGRDQAADFFPVGQFRNTYYRPDVVSKVLKTLDEQLAVKAANAERGIKNQTASVEDLLPPVVDIISPSDGSKLQPGEITVKYRLRSPTGDPVTGIMAMVDGRTVAVERGLALNVGAGGVEREVKIGVPEGASLISLLAINRNAPSAASVVQVRTNKDRGAEIAGQPPPQQLQRPKLYVLAIGVGKYAQGSGLPTLAYPAKDAQDFAAAFQRQKGRGYQEVVVKVLPDATHDDVVDGLDWISKTATEKDVAMIFLAGHGITDGSDFYYFMPADANLEQPKRRGVAFAEIENTLVSLKGQKVLFVDTCRSGAVLGKRGIIDINGIANKLNRETSGVAVFTASMGNESAEESTKWGNGAFTSALLDGLSGKADFDGSGEISFSMLDRFITKRVRELTSNRQTPTATKPLTVPDFLVAMTR